MSSLKTCPTKNGKDFYTVDPKNPNLCVHPSMQCSLGTDPQSYNGIPAESCYDAFGNVKPAFVPPSGSGSGIGGSSGKHKKSILKDQCSPLMPFGGDSRSKPKIVLDIENLQKQEMKILQEMKKDTDISTGAVKDKGKMKSLLAQLKTMQDARVRLLQQLTYTASTTQCTLSGDRRALQDQIAMLYVAEDQLKTLEMQTQEIINARTDKHRMVQITNYEYNRFSSHAGIFKTIAFCSLFILGGVYLNGIGWTVVGNTVIILSIAVAVFLTIKRIWWNYYRNPMNWNQFEWQEKTPGGHQPSVWEVDKKFFEKGYNQAKSEFHKVEKDTKGAYNKVKKETDKAYKGLTKDISQSMSHLANKKGSLATESFAPYN